MRRYRILFVLTPQFHPNTGGVQMSTYKLAKWFSQAGHDVGVFSFEMAAHIDQNFAQLFAAPETGGPADERNLKALESVLKESQPDIVINQMPYEHEIGEVLRRFNPPLLLGCLRNTLFSVRNNLDQYGLRVLPKGVACLLRNSMGRTWLLRMHRSRHRRDLKRIIANHDYFVMFAPPNLEELRFFVPDFDESKIKLIPNSIPTVLDRVPRKEKRLLWLGRLSYDQKRADLILPVWRRVQATLKDWKLDVVGGGPAFEDLRREILAEGIEGVTLYGQQEPDEYFMRASIFLMTSAFEGFPNTLIEAQCFGAIPVLFNSFPVAEWIVANGVNGFLVPPFDVNCLADQIVTIAEDESKINLMVNALENARRFHVDTVGQSWEQLFDECMQRKADRSAAAHRDTVANC